MNESFSCFLYHKVIDVKGAVDKILEHLLMFYYLVFVPNAIAIIQL